MDSDAENNQFFAGMSDDEEKKEKPAAKEGEKEKKVYVNKNSQSKVKMQNKR